MYDESKMKRYRIYLFQVPYAIEVLTNKIVKGNPNFPTMQSSTESQASLANEGNAIFNALISKIFLVCKSKISSQYGKIGCIKLISGK